MCWKHSRVHGGTNPKTGIEKYLHAHTENPHIRTLYAEQCHWLSFEDAAMNILCLCILKCNTKHRMPVRFTDGKAAEDWRLEDEGKRLDICCRHYSSGQTRLGANGEGYKVYIWYQTINDIGVKWGAIKDLLGQWEEGLKRKRVSGFVSSPGALKRSNYHTAVKMHASTSHWDVLSCFSAIHGSSSPVFPYFPTILLQVGCFSNPKRQYLTSCEWHSIIDYLSGVSMNSSNKSQWFYLKFSIEICIYYNKLSKAALCLALLYF